MPATLTEFRAFRPSKRPGAVACASTGALHAEQLNEYEVEEAAEKVAIWFPCVDAGSKRELSAMLVGGVGLLRRWPSGEVPTWEELIDGESPTSEGDYYRDALGMEILASKMGAASAASILRVFERRGVKEYYFVGSDAANDMTGHKTGVIAYLRRDRKCAAIYVNRCLAHITARSLKHMLQAKKKSLKVKTTRTSLKRKQARAKGRRACAAAKRAQREEEEEEQMEVEDGEGGEGGEPSAEEDNSVALPAELKLVEDVLYVTGKWTSEIRS